MYMYVLRFRAAFLLHMMRILSGFARIIIIIISSIIIIIVIITIIIIIMIVIIVIVCLSLL